MKRGVYIVSTQTPNQWVEQPFEHALDRPAQAPAKITKTLVERLAPPASGQKFIRDAILRGFAVRVTASGVRAFVVEKRLDGRVKRITLGRYGELTVEQARKEALKVLGKIAIGLNPLAEREHARLAQVTLEQAFEDFKRTRKDLKARTLYDYERLLKVAFEPWKKRPLAAITKDLVVRRHAELGKTSGEAYANLAMRFLRSLLNFALVHFEDGFGKPLLTENPVSRLTQTRAWYRSRRRQTVIKVHQLPAWFKAVQGLRGEAKDPFAEVVADYLEVLLFTGLRRQEAAQLTWDRVDLKDRTLVIPDPKNRQPFLLPFSDHVAAIFERRKESAERAHVFPGGGRQGYLIEPRYAIERVIETSGVDFTIHDLRRTFITVAESIDLQPYAIKRMVNHKMRGDVTAGYIVADVERLREPVKRVADFLLKAIGVKESAAVVSLREAKHANT